jgi:hypothetical protein
MKKGSFILITSAMLMLSGCAIVPFLPALLPMGGASGGVAVIHYYDESQFDAQMRAEEKARKNQDQIGEIREYLATLK